MQLMTFAEIKRCFSLKTILRTKFPIQYMFVNFTRNLEQVKLEQNFKNEEVNLLHTYSEGKTNII